MRQVKVCIPSYEHGSPVYDDWIHLKFRTMREYKAFTSAYTKAVTTCDNASVVDYRRLEHASINMRELLETVIHKKPKTSSG